MWEFLWKVVGLVVPPDPCPWELPPGADPKTVEEAKRAMRRWQLGIAGTLGVALVGLAVAAFTDYGFAYAADVKEQIAAEIRPVKESISKIEGKLTANEVSNKQVVTLLNELKAVTVADNLDRLIKRKCREADIDELRALRREIQDNKDLYQSLLGDNKMYVEPTCTELVSRGS